MKSNKWTKLLALVLALVMVFGVMAGCSKDEPDTKPSTTTPDDTTPSDTTDTDTQPEGPADEGGDTLVVGYANFSQKFSPFFATTAYDQDAQTLTQISMLTSDRAGAVLLNGIEGDTVNYNGTDYTYYGAANCVITQNDDGSVDYDLTMRDDITFSDGTPVTIDDAIFSLYVYLDPSYDGAATMYALPIEGINEYRSGMSTIWSLIFDDLAAGNDTSASEYYTAEDAAAFEAAFTEAGTKFAQEIVDYVCGNYMDYAPSMLGHEADEVTANEGLQTALGMALWGFGEVADDVLTDTNGDTYDFASGVYPTAEDYWNNIFAAYGYDMDGLNGESAGTELGSFIADTLLETAPALAASVQTGNSADHITGIQKTGDYSMRIHMTEYDATAIYNMTFQISPLHYYGDVSLYDYDNNQFGFPKGDLSGVKSKTTQPLGAGPYKFIEYKDGIIYYEANETYFLGAPKTKYLRLKETNEADKVTGVYSGSLDISDPTMSQTTVATLKGQNSNGEMTGDAVTTYLIDNLGYGYIGIQANVVSVGGVSDSQESKDLRKAFATLFAVYRDTVIDSYYGELASVIQYPISNTSWAAPRPADEGYEIAFSHDVDGNSIYTDSMTPEERYAAALEAAKGFLIAAGYTWDEAAGKFTAAPEGASLSYEFQIPANGVGDHPVFGVVTNTATALATIGIDLQVTDLSNSSTLWDALDAGTCAFWAAAWQATPDPDMYQVYHGDNVVGAGGTDSNKYAINDARLNELILDGRRSSDTAYRKSVYKEALDIVLDWACEVPTYQRQNAFVMSTERVNIDSVPTDMTPYYGWLAEVQNIEMN